MTPVALRSVVHTVPQQIPAVFKMSRGCRAASPTPPPKNSCRTYLATPLSLCCGEICLQNRIALDGGVAATPTPIALHCFTKVRNFPDLLLHVFADSLLPVYGKGSPCFLGGFSLHSQRIWSLRGKKVRFFFLCGSPCILPILRSKEKMIRVTNRSLPKVHEVLRLFVALAASGALIEVSDGHPFGCLNVSPDNPYPLD